MARNRVPSLVSSMLAMIKTTRLPATHQRRQGTRNPQPVFGVNAGSLCRVVSAETMCQTATGPVARAQGPMTARENS